METAVWHRELSIHLYLQVSLQRVIGLVRGLWFLLNCRCWALSRTPLGYPVVVLCCGHPEALGLWVRSLRAPIDHEWDGCWGGPNNPVSLPVLPCRKHQGELWPNSSLTATSEGWGQFCFHTTRVGSATLTPWGLFQLCCPSKVQRPLSGVLWQVRGRDNLCAPGPVRPPVSGIDGLGGGGKGGGHFPSAMLPPVRWVMGTALPYW